MDKTSASPPIQASGSSRTAFDQLDALVRVTSVQGWVYLAVLFAVGAGSVLFAFLYQVPTKVNGEGILLIERDALVQVRARATGRLKSLGVQLGDRVDSGDEIGRISQDELIDLIHEGEAMLAERNRENNELTAFEERERATKSAAMDRLREAILRAQADGSDKLKLAGLVVAAANRLRAKKYLGDQDVLESREKLYDIRDDLNKAKSRLAELELEGVTADYARRRARLERRLRIQELETRLKLQREKLDRNARLISPARGRVAQVLSASGGLVHEGAPVILLHASRADRGGDDPGPSYDSIVFVPAGEGKKIEAGNPVEVVPATVRREEHGFIRGRVVGIAELPATKLAMEAALEHPELVDAFLRRYAPGVVLRVQVKLDEPATAGAAGPGPSDRRNPFLWSSSSGRAQPLKTGTICQAAIIVERRPLIWLILPWTRKLVGAD